MVWTAVVRVEGGRIAKYLEFPEEAPALEFCVDRPGAFVIAVPFRADMVVNADGSTAISLPDLWRDEVTEEMKSRRDRLMLAATSLQADFMLAGNTVQATAVRDFKNGLATTENDPVVQGASSYAEYRQAVRSLWQSLAQPLPVAVRQFLARFL